MRRARARPVGRDPADRAPPRLRASPRRVPAVPVARSRRAARGLAPRARGDRARRASGRAPATPSTSRVAPAPCSSSSCRPGRCDRAARERPAARSRGATQPRADRGCDRRRRPRARGRRRDRRVRVGDAAGAPRDARALRRGSRGRVRGARGPRAGRRDPAGSIARDLARQAPEGRAERRRLPVGGLARRRRRPPHRARAPGRAPRRRPSGGSRRSHLGPRGQALARDRGRDPPQDRQAHDLHEPLLVLRRAGRAAARPSPHAPRRSRRRALPRGRRALGQGPRRAPRQAGRGRQDGRGHPRGVERVLRVVQPVAERGDLRRAGPRDRVARAAEQARQQRGPPLRGHPARGRSHERRHQGRHVQRGQERDLLERERARLRRPAARVRRRVRDRLLAQQVRDRGDLVALRDLRSRVPQVLRHREEALRQGVAPGDPGGDREGWTAEGGRGAAARDARRALRRLLEGRDPRRALLRAGLVEPVDRPRRPEPGRARPSPPSSSPRPASSARSCGRRSRRWRRR